MWRARVGKWRMGLEEMWRARVGKWRMGWEEMWRARMGKWRMGWEEIWRARVGEVVNGVGRNMWRCGKLGGGGEGQWG